MLLTLRARARPASRPTSVGRRDRRRVFSAPVAAIGHSKNDLVRQERRIERHRIFGRLIDDAVLAEISEHDVADSAEGRIGALSIARLHRPHLRGTIPASIKSSTISRMRSLARRVGPATRALALLAALAILSAGPGSAQPSAFERFRNTLVDYFASQNYVPVLLNRGYTVGDVVEVDGVNFYARALRCFPRLKLPEPVQTSLTDVLESNSIGMSFGLRLRQIFDSSAGADLVSRIRIEFSDVTVVSVARLDLKDALDRQVCPEIAPLVDATVTAVGRNRKPFFVVSEVLSGKRQATLTLADKANLRAKADRIAQQVANAQVTVEVTAEGLISLKSDVVMPIALKPVTVPKVVLVGQFGNIRGPEQVELKWDPLECTARQACAALFDPFADLVKESRPKLDEEDLVQ
jgi:hypothetical protein